jgi:hypothetical protein
MTKQIIKAQRAGECKHPDRYVSQLPSDKAWEGTCEKCGKRVKLCAAPVKEKP